MGFQRILSIYTVQEILPKFLVELIYSKSCSNPLTLGLGCESKRLNEQEPNWIHSLSLLGKHIYEYGSPITTARKPWVAHEHSESKEDFTPPSYTFSSSLTTPFFMKSLQLHPFLLPSGSCLILELSESTHKKHKKETVNFTPVNYAQVRAETNECLSTHVSKKE